MNPLALYLWIVLSHQTTRGNTSTADWTSGNWFEGVANPFLELLGPLFPLILGIGIAGMVMIWSGSMSLPVVLMILIGGMLIPFLPPEAQMGAQILLLAGIALALYNAWMHGGNRR